MVELQRLELVIDASGAVTGAAQFVRATDMVDKGSKQGAQGVNRFGDSLDKSERQVNRFSRSMQTLVASYFSVRTVQAIGNTADSMTNLRNRLRLVTDSSEGLETVQRDLIEISNDTRSSLQTNAELYNRLALSTTDLGTSQADLLTVTKALNQAVAISGATATEAQAGLIQLSQGLASGALRGDELRSVLEQLPFVARVIADELGVSIGELRRLGSEGKISAETVIDAFTNSAGAIDQQFAKVRPTISSAFTVLRNSFAETISAIDQSTGATELFAQALLSLSQGFPTARGRGFAQGIFEGIPREVQLVQGELAKLDEALQINEFFGGSATVAALDVQQAVERVREAMSRLTDEQRAGTGDENITLIFRGYLERAQEALAVSQQFQNETGVADWAREIRDSWSGLLPTVTGLREALTQTYVTLTQQPTDAALAVDSLTQRLEDQIAVLRITNPAARATEEAVREINRAMADGSEVTDDQREAISGYITELQRLQTAEEARREDLQETRRAVEVFQSETQRLADGLTRVFFAAAEGADSARESLKRLILEFSQSQLRNGLRQALAFDRPQNLGLAGSSDSAGNFNTGLGGSRATGGSAFGFDSVGNDITFARHGTVSDGGPVVRRFARGGYHGGFIQETPALMGHPGGGQVEFAEAGRPEAVVPLTRMSSGNLGIEMSGGGSSGPSNVTVNQTYNGNTTARDQRLSARQAARQLQKELQPRR